MSEIVNLKSEKLLQTKKYLNLSMNLLIAVLGVTSLFVKFFMIDGVVAFRAFTVNGNLYTTIVSIVAVVMNLKELFSKKEADNSKMFYFELASAVTEAVIFIVVMIGYLPFFDDDPKITPYHMFCLHLAIPVLAVVRFILFEKPQGVLKPALLLRGSIPIGVYGFGVIIAIKTGILPIRLVPYSFLNFEANFFWYFLFALVVIPSFGYMWAWMFYRLNIKASILWYSKEDVERIKAERVRNLSRFDVVNSSILLIYCAFGILVLMFALMGSSRTTTKVQEESMTYTSFYILDDFNYRLGKEDWEIRDGALYKGNLFIGDGTEENYNKKLLPDDRILYESCIFVARKDLTASAVKDGNPYDFVCVNHSSGKTGPIYKCGDVLDSKIVSEVLYGDNSEWAYYKIVKIDKVKYYHIFLSFGKNFEDSGVGIVSMYVPVSDFTVQAKNAEFNNDITMIFVVFLTFSLMYLITIRWIKVLQKSLIFVKDIAADEIPESPITLGKSKRMSGLEKELNSLRENKLNKDNQ